MRPPPLGAHYVFCLFLCQFGSLFIFIFFSNLFPHLIFKVLGRFRRGDGNRFLNPNSLMQFNFDPTDAEKREADAARAEAMKGKKRKGTKTEKKKAKKVKKKRKKKRKKKKKKSTKKKTKTEL